MNLLKTMKDWVGGGRVVDSDPVFLLGPRQSGKTIFLASLYNVRNEDLNVVWESKETQIWKEQTMRVFFEAIEPMRTDRFFPNDDYSPVNQFKDEARSNFYQLASNPTDKYLFKRMMLNIALNFSGDPPTAKRRVSLLDPSGELFVQSDVLDLPGYAKYVEMLSTAVGYLVVVGADAGICQTSAGAQASAVLRVFHKLREHAGRSSYIDRPVSVVMMKMDQHMDCCLQCGNMSGQQRTELLRKAGLDNDRMAGLFEQMFHFINRKGVPNAVQPGMLRFFGVSAYGFRPNGQSACTPSANGEDLIPTSEASPVNIAEPLRWALGVNS